MLWGGQWLNIMYQCDTVFEKKTLISASLGVHFMILSGLYYGWCQQTYLKRRNFNGYSGKIRRNIYEQN